MNMTARPDSPENRALNYLRLSLNNPKAAFRPGQWQAIETLVYKKSKLLVVQKTGWGKSVIYFLATRLLREEGYGPTLLVSPLLSLIRNQLDMADRLGLHAYSVNSTNRDEWKSIEEMLQADIVDILLISPERLANEEFLNKYLNRVISHIGLFIVDEAHCISDWGHEFRPDYMRIARILRALPPNTPALATTATANNRVMEDIVSQVGEGLQVIRGGLMRPELHLQNMTLPDPAARMAWLAEKLPSLPGSGIIYALTIRDTEILAQWLQRCGLNVLAYHADIESDERVRMEGMLLRNETKALVATTALGMGFDKPDLGFVIHYQRPASVVHYYQQVGRAGRAVDKAYGILMGGREDDEIADYFLQNALPASSSVESILQTLESAADGLTLTQILARVNMPMNRLEKTLKILSVDSPSPITRHGNVYYRTAVPYIPDTYRATQLMSLRKKEQQRMTDYLNTSDCLMQFLAAELDDDEAIPCGICSSCMGKPFFAHDFDTKLAIEASRFLRKADIKIAPRLQWPSGLPDTMHKGKIGAGLMAEEGRAMCRWGDAGWGEMVRRGKQIDDVYNDELVAALCELISERWQPSPHPQWVTCVPSLRHPNLVPGLAQNLAHALGLSFRPCILTTHMTEPQKLMNNSQNQYLNIADAFTLDESMLDPSPVLLVDDMIDSGWTFTVITALLRSAGCEKVYPVALAKT